MKNLFIAIILLFPIIGNAQIKKTIKIDLAQKGKYKFKNIGTDSFRIVMTNRIPALEYHVEIEELSNDIPALTGDYNKKSPLIVSASDPTNKCNDDELKSIIDRIKKEEQENRLRALVAELKRTLSYEGCSSAWSLVAEDIIAQTTDTIFEGKIDDREKLKVKIIRDSGNKKWDVSVAGKNYHEWITTFGFSFVNIENKVFFSKKVGVDSFAIIQDPDSKRKWDYIPTIMFTYLDNFFNSPSFFWGISGGLGFDLKAPTVFLGASFIYRKNLVLTVGGVMHQQKELSGKYTLGEIINGPIAEDELYKKVYRPNCFVSLSFRLDKSPFK